MTSLTAKVLNVKTWSQKTKITYLDWKTEKWRYCNNIRNPGFKEAKGDAKGQIWVHNLGNEYRAMTPLLESSQQIETKPKKEKIKPETCVLNAFKQGISLAEQYENASDNHAAFIASKFEFLSKMIHYHLKLVKTLAKRKKKFTKEDFNLIPEAENHNFDEKCLVIRGAPGKGKTQYAKTFFETPLMVGHLDKLKEFNPLLHDGIIFDDVSFGHHPRDPVIQIFKTEEDGDINVKCSMVTIPAGTPKIFCTNRELRRTEFVGYDQTAQHDKVNSFLPPLLEMEEGMIDDSIDRRFMLVTVGDNLRKAKKQAYAQGGTTKERGSPSSLETKKVFQIFK